MEDNIIDEANIVYRAIVAYDNSFMYCIGETMVRTDMGNLKKIKAAWNKEWDQYLKMGKALMERENE